MISALVKCYVQHIPFDKGKTRLISLAGRLCPRIVALHVTKFGAVMDLDTGQYIDGEIYYRGAYESHVLEIYNQLNRNLQFDFMLDVGANVGQHALFCYKALGLKNIHCFEADPRMAARLARNLELNAVGAEIKLHNLAIGDRLGQVVLHRPDSSNPGRNYVDSRPIPDEREGVLNETVPMHTLDSVLVSEPIGRRGLLKLDIEGAELLALEGAEKLLASNRISAIHIEVCQEHLVRMGSSIDKLFSLLQRHGYIKFEIDSRKPFLRRSQTNTKFADFILVKSPDEIRGIAVA